jgi:pyruvate formate lyase activating enzyme
VWRDSGIRLGGIQKTSLIDYPGKLSCVLFVTGCNFHCPYCHNPELVRNKTTPPTAPTAEYVNRFLWERREFLDGVVISGGEPTLHTGLFSLCRYIKTLGYPIKIDTNGSRPEVLARLLGDGLVDYVAMDVKTDPGAYRPQITREDVRDAVCRSIRLIRKAGIHHEFRTTCVGPFVGPAVMEILSRLLAGCERYVLQEYQETRVLDPDFMQHKAKPLTRADMEHLKTIVAPHVGLCTIR